MVRGFKRLESMEAMRAVHRKITDAAVAEVTAQVLGTMATMSGTRAATKPLARRTKDVSLKKNAYRLKIALRGSGKPPIWRRVIVPAEITLDQLHVVMQVVMGWENDHSHRFEFERGNFPEVLTASLIQALANRMNRNIDWAILFGWRRPSSGMSMILATVGRTRLCWRRSSRSGYAAWRDLHGGERAVST